jgi:vacuolar-type H+-ATPase subunit I/STV1
MSDLEMVITNQAPAVIDFNFEEVKATLQSIISQYSGLIVTDESLSLCKEKQRSLAGLRTKIDAYRKEVKREMLKPIEEFEDKCNELKSLVEKAEKPLKDGIQVYDDLKREEKRQIALKIIADSVATHGLTEKYAKQVTVIDKYTNLTAKVSDVKEDVERRVFVLLEQQKKEQEMLDIIIDAINNENKTIKTPLNISHFQTLLDLGMSTKDVLSEIKNRAEQIRQAENPAEPEKEEPAPKVVESTPEEATEIWFAELRFVETRNRIIELRNLLSTNGFKYIALKQGKIE